MRIHRTWAMGFAVIVFPLLVHAQGVLLPEKEKPPEAKPQGFLISENLTKDMTVKDSEGHARPVLSYKKPTDILVIGFFSPRCAANKAAWLRLKRLYEELGEWRVSFVGISVNSDETLGELADAMKQAGLPFPAVRDEGQKLARALQITGTPEILIVDEWGQLRYRGPLDDGIKDSTKTPKVYYVRNALETIIGHVDEVPLPEPNTPIGCAIQ